MPLENDDQHGGVLDDELEAAAQRLAGNHQPAVVDDNDETDETDPAEPPSGAAAPPAASEGANEDTWEYDLEGDQKLVITREQARAYAEFEAFLAQNPQLAEAIGGAVSGTHKFLPVETPAPTSGSTAGSTVDTPDPLLPPEALDMDDPVQKAVWERLVATNQQLAQATEIVQRHEQQFQQTQEQTTRGWMNKAIETYQSANKLTDEDMVEIQQVAARLNVLPALMAPVDPISGLPRNVDPLKSIESAFDLAHWQIPRLRDAQLATFQQEARDNTKRKKKLSSLGGSSGSVPRQPTAVPTNKQERRQAMLSEMTSMLNGNWIQPEDS